MSQLHVICKLAESEYAIPADDVYQMESFMGATRVPGAPSYVIGLVQVRQQIIPVIDLRLRFGLPAQEVTLDSRIVVLRLKERLVGLLVDSAKEVQPIAADLFRAPPETIASASGGFVLSIAQLKNRIIMLLDSEKVVAQGELNA